MRGGGTHLAVPSRRPGRGPAAGRRAAPAPLPPSPRGRPPLPLQHTERRGSPPGSGRRLRRRPPAPPRTHPSPAAGGSASAGASWSVPAPPPSVPPAARQPPPPARGGHRRPASTGHFRFRPPRDRAGAGSWRHAPEVDREPGSVLSVRRPPAPPPQCRCRRDAGGGRWGRGFGMRRGGPAGQRGRQVGIERVPGAGPCAGRERGRARVPVALRLRARPQARSPPAGAVPPAPGLRWTSERSSVCGAVGGDPELRGH